VAVVYSVLVAAQAAQTLGAPLAVVGETAVAFDDENRLWRECDWRGGLCSERCDDRLADCAAGAEGVLVVEAYDDHATGSCQGWARTAGDISRVRIPQVLDKKREVVRSNHCSSW
jgi:hypothetical protein